MKGWMGSVLVAALVWCCAPEPPPPPPAQDKVIAGPERPVAPAVEPQPVKKSLNAPMEYLDTVLHGLSSRERILRDTMQQAVGQYKALEGRYPKDLDEMKKAGFSVPKLREGLYWKLEPESGKVFVMQRVRKTD